MNWCPQCKKEYNDDISTCPKCASNTFKGKMEDYSHIFSNENEEISLRIYNILKDSDIESAEYFFDEDDLLYHIYVKNYDDIASKEIIISVIQNFIDKGEFADELLSLEESEDELMSDLNNFSGNNTDVYVSAKDKYNNLISSAYSLLFVGILGIIFLLLENFGVFSLNLSGSTRPLFYITMSILFVIFIIMGFFSLKNAAKSKAQISIEDTLKHDILLYLNSELDLNNIPGTNDHGLTSEELFLIRTSYLKNTIMKTFSITDESFADYLLDSEYNNLFTFVDKTQSVDDIHEVDSENV